MTLNYDELMASSKDDLPLRYSDTEAMLYAHSIGFGRDPLDQRELPFVYEQGAGLRTVPSMASVLVPDMFPPDLGWDFAQVLHAEQRLSLHRPLPPSAELLINKRTVDVIDRGPRRGAMLLFEADGRLAKDDTAQQQEAEWLSKHAQGTVYERSAIIALARLADEAVGKAASPPDRAKRAAEATKVYKRLVEISGDTPEAIKAS